MSTQYFPLDQIDPNPYPTHAVDAFNDLFKKARMRLMVDVSTETEG